MHALIIEDEPLVAMAVEDVLRELGYGWTWLGELPAPQPSSGATLSSPNTPRCWAE